MLAWILACPDTCSRGQLLVRQLLVGHLLAKILRCYYMDKTPRWSLRTTTENQQQKSDDKKKFKVLNELYQYVFLVKKKLQQFWCVIDAPSNEIMLRLFARHIDGKTKLQKIFCRLAVSLWRVRINMIVRFMVFLHSSTHLKNVFNSVLSFIFCCSQRLSWCLIHQTSKWATQVDGPARPDLAQREFLLNWAGLNGVDRRA